jgi:ribonucleotide monophosphatase NagD (HAD superfamily)
MLRRIPAIVSDIDGVLVRGKHAIPIAAVVLKNIMTKKFIH